MARATRPRPDALGDRPGVTLGGLAVALFGLPLVAPVADLLGVDLPPAAEVVVPLCFALVVVAIVVGVEDRTLSSIGLRAPDLRDVAYAVATFVAALLAVAATSPIVSALGLSGTGGSTLADESSIAVALGAAVAAGAVEELLYRGYPVERLLEATDSALVAGVVPWLAFTLAHVPGYPLGHVLQMSLGALVFTVVYLRRRSLFPVVAAHVAVNVAGVLSAAYA